MKRYIILLLLFAGYASLIQCNSTKKVTAVTAPVVFYESEVRTLIEAKCAPCHLPAKGGNKAPLATYENVVEEIDNIISRVNMNPGDRGFMPFKHDKLSAGEIAIFTQWKAGGMAKTK